MAYRDERDALRSRSEGLSQELDATRRELEATRARLAAHETKDVEDERRIAELTRKVERLEGRAPARDGGGAKAGAVVAGVFALATVGGAMFYMLSARPPPFVPPTPGLPAPAQEAPSPVKARPAVSAAPATVTRHVMFRGTVARVSGAPVALGSSCKMEADLVATGERRDVRDLVLSCDQTRLYKRGEHDGQTIISSSRWDYEEAPAATAGRYRYHLLFEDKGQRSSRLYQIFVDTGKKRARLWKDEPDPASLDLVIDEWSDEHAGEPLVRPGQQ